jgi:stearoyl-CoA desaturase (delta-9 desaturase)
MVDAHAQAIPHVPTAARLRPRPKRRSPRMAVERAVTATLVAGPLVMALALAVFWFPPINPRDVFLAVGLYLVTGHGVTVGFHRLFTHRSFRAKRPLEIALAVAGSMAVQGSLVSWVANHRRHHRCSDRPGDPHSPHGHGRGARAQLRGFVHAHVGWLFVADPVDAERYAADIMRDGALARVSRLFPVIALTSLTVPFVLGWGLSGDLSGGVSALLWAGVLRMALLHHVTWSVNSVCHMFGRRPYETNDRSSNFAPLGLISMGESWHNFHHAMPNSARHGVGRWQLDSSAGLIRMFERTRWATEVRWPSDARVRELRQMGQTL